MEIQIFISTLYVNWKPDSVIRLKEFIKQLKGNKTELEGLTDKDIDSK